MLFMGSVVGWDLSIVPGRLGIVLQSTFLRLTGVTGIIAKLTLGPDLKLVFNYWVFGFSCTR